MFYIAVFFQCNYFTSLPPPQQQQQKNHSNLVGDIMRLILQASSFISSNLSFPRESSTEVTCPLIAIDN